MTYTAEVAWPSPGDLTDDQIDALGTGLPGFPVAFDNGVYLYLKFDIEAPHMSAAVEQAVDLADAAHGRAFGANRDPVQVSVCQTKSGFVPGRLDLVSSVDVAQALGVTRQRVSQLHSEGKLPAPLGLSAGAPVWVRAVIEGFAQQRTARTPGD